MTRFLLAALLTLAAALPLRAEPAATRLRGIVEQADGDSLTVRRAGGGTQTLRMDARTRVFAVIGAKVRDIKPESYVSVLSGSGPEPHPAAGVMLYSPSERGFEAGRQPWDGAPGAMLTAGWIAELRAGDPALVTLAYHGGRTAFAIPPVTPVTQIAPGEKALLVPGAAVTVFTQARPDGSLEAGLVAVGRMGAVPNL